MVAGATVTAYDSGGGVIESRTTDADGKVTFGLDTCRTAYVIIASKAGYTACGTGVDRFGHGGSPWVSGGDTLYIFPEQLPIACGALSGQGLVTVTTDPDNGFTANWRYAATIGTGSQCSIPDPYGLCHWECGGGNSAASIQFQQNLGNGYSYFLRSEGAPIVEFPSEAYAGCHYTGLAYIDSSGPCPQWIIDCVNPNISDPQCCPFASNFAYADFADANPTISCPTGDPVATGTIADYNDVYGTPMGLVYGAINLGAPP